MITSFKQGTERENMIVRTEQQLQRIQRNTVIFVMRKSGWPTPKSGIRLWMMCN
jgi:hypothetical protein